ncbi:MULTISPECIES: hypothetical protein [unclassified Achromobacter]|nr:MULTISPECIES: hypothetical protein [unclassified Achromobacter]
MTGTLLASTRLNGQRRPYLHKETDMRGILLWLLGIPIPVIILLWLFHVI